MEDGNSSSSGGGKSAGGRTKTTGIPTSTRLQRNQAEKERRDKLNGFISELATLVPMVSNASKPLDKVSILRLAAAEMRLHFSCLNPKRYKNKPLVLPPTIVASLDLIEKTVGGFVLVTTLTGVIVFCSRSIEDYLGYQNIDVMGNKVVKYIYEDDIKYFEAKVSSVVNSLKKGSKKKTKVIKAHMLQKPLPRSNESCRPRNMIFKISVHKNDVGENGSESTAETTGAVKKNRSQKDYGYSAVVLMFIEPVRLEPEIDITYIDSNQDVYFTRHGLQGEIIYADQRISTITGYMPHDVQGTSAYQYICSSDIPIALFAQKAMFTSSDGKGDIVYRLRIRDMRFIYLQSSGQIAYKESSNEISHFVCFNRLLSEEEGSQELRKFQQRYAPQIMAAKMLQVKQKNAADSQPVEAALDQAMSLGSSPGTMQSPMSETSSLQRSKGSSPEMSAGSSDQMLSNDGFMSPPSMSLSGTNSVHSSEGHSMTGTTSRSNSIKSEYGGYGGERMDFSVEKSEQMSPQLNECSSFVAGTTYESVVCVSKGKSLGKEVPVNGLNRLGNSLFVIGESSRTANALSVNGTLRMQQDGSCVDAKSQIMHSVNAFSGLQENAVVLDSSQETVSDHLMDSSFEHVALQKKTAYECNAAPSNQNVYDDKSIVLTTAATVTNGHRNAYAMCNGHIGNGEHSFISLQNNLQLPVTQQTAAQNQQPLNFGGEQISQNGLPPPSQNLLSFSGVYEISSASSLPKTSYNSLSVVSDISDTAVDYCPGVNSYPVNGNSDSGGYLSASTNGAFVESLDALNRKTFVAHEMNGFSSASPAGVGYFPAMNSFEPMDAPILSPEKTEFPSAESPMDVQYVNGSCEPYSSMLVSGPEVFASQTNWAAGHQDLGLNKELYEELDLFFQNLPQSNGPQNGGVPVDVGSSNYKHQNSISSSKAKRSYQ